MITNVHIIATPTGELCPGSRRQAVYARQPTRTCAGGGSRKEARVIGALVEKMSLEVDTLSAKSPKDILRFLRVGAYGTDTGTDPLTLRRGQENLLPMMVLMMR